MIRVLLVAAFLALAGVPVWVLTGRETTVLATASPRTGAKSEAVDVELSATRPALVTVSVAGKEIAAGPLGDAGIRATINIPEGSRADLVVTAKWEETASQNALRVVARHDGETLADSTLWGEGEVKDVVTVSATP